MSKAAIEEINREFAIVKTGGILCLDDDRVISASKLRDWLANREVTASQWLSSPDRREYDRIVFEPGRKSNGNYNLWKGFAFTPSRKGSCDLFLAHVRDHVCGGDEALFRWVMSFWAELVQKPMEKSGVALALRGPPGSGKTTLGEVIGKLIPDHYLLVDSPDQVTGRFNAHMARLLLLQADDVFFNDKRNAGKLRSMITRHEHVIEPKGVDAYRVPNYMRLFVTSEADWVVPASLGERRWGILDITDDVVGDTGFFNRLREELEDGGYARLLHELLNFDMVDLRKLPQTQGLNDNKIQSLDPDMAWWANCLERGAITGGAWKERISREDVLSSYVGAMSWAAADRSTQTSLGIFLRKVLPEVRDPRGDYIMPPLSKCREYFERKFKVRLGLSGFASRKGR
jgi:hypothetical protein